MSEQRTVWLVTKVGVYDHGVFYVADSEGDAQRFTEEYVPDADGYHEWRIDSVQVGAMVADEDWVSNRNRVQRRPA